MNNDNKLGLFEIAFNGSDRGIEVKQFGEKEAILGEEVHNQSNEIEMSVMTANENMDIPELTDELINKINANASVRVTESEIARRKVREANRMQRAFEGEDR